MSALSDQVNRAGIHAVGSIFTKLKWAFREQPTSDFGIDAQAEKLDDGGEGTGKLVALQIKTGRSWFRKRGDDYVFYGEPRHRHYWTNHSLPVFIVLHDPESDLTLWQKVELHLLEEGKDGRWAILIPANQTLDSKHEEYILRGVAADHSSVRRYRLAIDLPLIRQFAEHTDIYIRVQDWVNKTLNFRGTDVVFDEDPEADPNMQLDTWLPAYTIAKFMDVHFPWLDWREHSYIDAMEGAGEVAVHVLRVRLNDIGEAALRLQEFYESSPVEDEPPEIADDHDWGALAAEFEIEDDEGVGT